MEAEDILPKKTDYSQNSGIWVRLKKTFAVTIGVLVVLIIVLMFARCSYRYRHPTPEQDMYMYKTSMRFRGFDNVDAEQHVTFAVSENYVMYHVNKLTERTWIIDDYQRSLQIMKITSPEDSICYVTHLNRTRSTAPDVYGSQLIGEEDATFGEQTRFQTMFLADEMQLDDISHLGAQAQNLCADTPIFWIRPVTMTTPSRPLPDTRHRDKRNVKKCMSSCCTLVCCCNQRYLQWQSVQKINCHNVCHGCTSMAKMDVRDMC